MKKEFLVAISISALFLFLGISLAKAASCPNVPISGDFAVATSCTFAYNVDGVDNGNLTINAGYTLTINAGQTVVWNPGKSVYVNGSIAINKGTPGGQLKKTLLWMIDADSDNYPSTTTQYFGDTAPANGRRRYLMSTITSVDCDDTKSAVQVTQTQYTDADGDNYTITGSSFCASASTWGDSACTTTGTTYAKNAAGSCILISALTGADCCDTDSRVNPGATWQTVGDAGCSRGWDFNCSGAVENYGYAASGNCTGIGTGSCSGSNESISFTCSGTAACGATAYKYCRYRIYDSSCLSSLYSLSCNEETDPSLFGVKFYRYETSTQPCR